MLRRFPVGAEWIPGEGTHYRVWAPRRESVEVVSAGAASRGFRLQREEGGYFSGLVSGMRPGARYWLRLDEDRLFPDPASRFQPEGPHGPSEIIDSAAFPWTDAGWLGSALEELVISEIHIGTFTPEGTWAAA